MQEVKDCSFEPSSTTSGNDALHLQLLKIVSGIAVSFAGASGEEIDHAVLSALGALGEFAGVDRSYVYRLSDGEDRWTPICEWCAPGIAPSVSKGESIPVDSMPWAFERLRKAPVFYLAHLENLPREAQAELSRWRGQGLKSTLAVSLLDDGRLFGIMGFDALRAVKEWEGEDVALLRTVAEVFALAWQRQQAQAELVYAKQCAEESNRLKAQFLANMSHEVRTPLNGVLGMAELLADTPLETTQSEYLSEIRRSGGALLTMFDAILDLAAIETGDLVLQLQECNPVAIVNALVEDSQPRARERHCRLEAQALGAVPECVICDPVRIRQILANLLDNAIKYTEQGSILVTVAAKGGSATAGELRFSVADSGAGIPLAERERIFERFTQIDGSMTRRHGGLGVGLTICRDLVRLLGGRMELQENPGGGTVVWFTVPLVV